MPTDYPAAFAALRAIMKKHSGGMIVKSDKPDDFTLVTRATAPNGHPMWFGAVLMKKSAVTYHLMPLYFNPKLQAAVDPKLLARKQGKTCFNFQRPDDVLFAKLDELTAEARRQWETLGFLNAATDCARSPLHEVKPLSKGKSAAGKTRRRKASSGH
jgi:hypothetical protein